MLFGVCMNHTVLGHGCHRESTRHTKFAYFFFFCYLCRPFMHLMRFWFWMNGYLHTLSYFVALQTLDERPMTTPTTTLCLFVSLATMSHDVGRRRETMKPVATINISNSENSATACCYSLSITANGMMTIKQYTTHNDTI